MDVRLKRMPWSSPTGHSARDVYEMLHEMSVVLEPKAFAMGVRVEHPQALINKIQYGRDVGHAALPSAYYRLATTVEDRGVFSFCMCPGGWIVPATTEAGAQVVNGMSLSKRRLTVCKTQESSQGSNRRTGKLRGSKDRLVASASSNRSNVLPTWRAVATFVPRPTMMKDFLARTRLQA